MTQINAYLNFNGNCREAMDFYKECLGGELLLQTVAETPMAAQCPAGMQHHIMHASLTREGGVMLMASDMTGPDGYMQGNTVSLALNCSSEEEIRRSFESLSEGGNILEPLKEQFWGSLFAAFADKFGVRWMLNYNKQSAS